MGSKLFGRAARGVVGLIVWTGAAWLGSTAVAASTPGDDAPIDFNREIRPILSDNCFACHGPDSKTRAAGLRLDIGSGAFAKLQGGGFAIVPGDSSASEVIRRVSSADPNDVMPPADSNKKLTPEQIALLKRWIDQGAKWQEHWAFVPPQKPPLPAVKNAGWARNPYDYFILAKLEAQGMTPAPPANRSTLIRRLYLDLTGLPPTLEQLDAAMKDARVDWYERLVDELLASPHYGEMMAQGWLDAARFGDTNGYHYDTTRDMWLWRDYVIQAFNGNKPFDQFTIEQIAGDLLPNATLEQQIASGFHRNTTFNEEGGADPVEFRIKYTVDRASTTGTVWLGLTMGCAECHDHKYDPISQKEFYQFFAFFNSVEEPQVSGNHGQPLHPLLRVPTPEHEATIEAARAELAQVQKQIAETLQTVSYTDPGFEAQAGERRTHIWVDDDVPAGAVAEGEWQWITADQGPVHSGTRSMKRIGNGINQHYFHSAGERMRVGTGDRVFVHVWIDPANPPRGIQVQLNGQHGNSDWLHRAFWGEDVCFGAGNHGAANHPMGELPPAGQWVRLEIDPVALGLGPGSVIHGMAFTQYGGVAYWDTAGIDSATPQQAEDYVWIDDDAPSGAELAGDGQDPAWHWVGGADHPVHSGLRSMRRSGNGLNQHYFTNASHPLHIHAGDKLFTYVWLDPANPPRTVQLQFNDGNWEHRAHWGADEGHGKGRSGAAFHRVGDLPETGKWVRLEVDAATIGLKPGAKLNGWAFTQVGGTVYWDKAGIETWAPPQTLHRRSMSYWEQVAKADSAVPQELRQALALAPDQRSDEQRTALLNYYVQHVYEGTRQQFDPLNHRVTELNRRIEETYNAMPSTMVMREMGERRPTHVLIRGDFQSPGEQVEADVPAVFPRIPEGYGNDRLGLAHWLVMRENPLTARVAVNRFWAKIFGTGIVKTVEDFGSQAEWPSHPELLDYMAVDFMDSGWDVKYVIRNIVTSATYRQASRTRLEYAEIDPYNRLLHRGARFRVPAEQVRDISLAASGLLSRKIGGPSVMPYQPANYYADKHDNWRWNLSKGEDLYRRGLYTFWRRTTPYPIFVVFDAPSREVCTVDRPRTNTPLQALATLNAPGFIEAARVLAQRVLTEAPARVEQRIVFAFRCVLSRQPQPREVGALRAFYQQQRSHFEQNPKEAMELVSNGEYPRPANLDVNEHAAWTAVCNVLLNLDEAITKE